MELLGPEALMSKSSVQTVTISQALCGAGAGPQVTYTLDALHPLQVDRP